MIKPKEHVKPWVIMIAFAIIAIWIIVHIFKGFTSC